MHVPVMWSKNVSLLHWFLQTWSICFDIAEVDYLCMMDVPGDHFEATAEDICRLFSSIAGKQGGLHWCSVLHCSRSESLVSALGWAGAGWSWFWTEIPQLSSATERERRVLTGSSPGGKDLAWTLNSRCCGFVRVHLCILTALKKVLFGGCIIGSPKALLGVC